MPQFLNNLIAFGGVLRAAGVDVRANAMLDVVRALEHVDLLAREEVYHACRALLVHAPEDIPPFDRSFDAFWREAADGREARNSRQRSQPSLAGIEALLEGSAEGGPSGDGAPSADLAMRTWSDRGGFANKDFAECTDDELVRAAAAIAALSWAPGERRTRRWMGGRGPRIDLRRAVARSRRTGGDVVALPRRRHRSRPRPLVLLCDVSGSMERYSRMLLLFAHALTAHRPRVEAFLFSTELTCVTLHMRKRRAQNALGAMSRAVPHWSGGTQIGRALRTFHQYWGRKVLNGGPIVLLISDGWDRGEPALLAGEIARLQRSCHRLVWLNPLLGTEHYAPLTRGLQAALPFVDDFLPARRLNDFADLASILNTLPERDR